MLLDQARAARSTWPVVMAAVSCHHVPCVADGESGLASPLQLPLRISHHRTREEVRRLREKKDKTIVAYLSSTGASGAYYVACAANKIVANPGTIVGSIGVIAEWVNYADLLEWAKLKEIVFKTGEFKDTGSPARALTDNERKYFQGLIDDMYVQFLEAVSSGRKLELQEVRAMADGRVFTGRDAQQRKLIDQIGNFQDAVDLTAKLAGISGKPRLLRSTRQRVTLLDMLTTDLSRFVPFSGQSMKSQIKFQYLWK